MFCTSCGQELPSDAIQCPTCAAAAGATAHTLRPPRDLSAPTPPPRGIPWYVIAGIAVLALMPFLGLAGLIAFKSHMARTKGPQAIVRQMICEVNIARIGQCCSGHQRQHGAWPTTLRAAYESDPAARPSFFFCPWLEESSPGDEHRKPWDEFSSRVGYEYRSPPGSITSGGTTEIPMAWDRKEHPDGRRCVVYSSGRVETLTPDQFARKFK